MISKELHAFLPVIEAKLAEILSEYDLEFDSQIRAMEYSLLAGGKRLRPFLLSLFYRAAGGTGENYLPFAAALEMIHTYSLIHDDLPCMDDDDLRRGRPACHKAFGEDTALLAGDGLLTLAFETAANTKGIDPGLVVRGIAILAECAGAAGMIGGQVIDLAIEQKPADLNTVVDMYRRKTGCLLVAAAKIGTLLAGGSAEQLSAAETYALSLGTAFQIQDDLLDLESDSVTLGKPVGSDSKNQKTTYVSLVGISQAKQDVLTYTSEAKAALDCFAETELLSALADHLIHRKN